MSNNSQELKTEKIEEKNYSENESVSLMENIKDFSLNIDFVDSESEDD